MSDFGGDAVSNGRTQNGGSRAPVPVPYDGVGRVRTPTDIMIARRDREARKKAENERREKEREEERRRIQEEERLQRDRTAATAGVAPSGEGTSYRRSGGTRKPTGDPTLQESGERRPGDRGSGGSTRANIPSSAQPVAFPSGNGRTEKNTAISPDHDAGTAVAPQPRTRLRGATLSTGQPRPVETKPTQTPRAVSAAAPAATTGQKEYRNSSANAATGTSQPRIDRGAAAPSQPQPRQDSGGSQQRSTNTSSFPHAFERWETLSSHWEGLTSFWIHRLEQNKEGFEREPLNQQMARQVTDLSAAGANLFHAVVELQRLRASSERKFQRWFFETRAEQERFREKESKFEERLQEERSAATNTHVDFARVQKERDAAISARKKSDLEIREKIRELDIAKREARRAWEELGRMEQEERDRTASLKSGQPTVVGGVQVVPMMQGGSGQGHTSRPAPRISDAAVPPQQQGLIENPPEDEPGYTRYDPARSETDTDPFAEGGRSNTDPPQVHQSEPERPFPASSMAQPQQPTSNGSAAAVQSTRTATSSAPQQPISQSRPTAPASAPGGTYLRYGPDGSRPATTQAGGSSFYQHEGTSLQGLPRVSEGDDRSYVPSVDDTLSEEDYDLDEHGEIRRDTQGDPIIAHHGLGSEDSDEYDVQDQVERERMYGRSYGSGVSGVEYGSGPPPAPGRQAAQGAPDYSGSGFGAGWEALPRHHHPTRLSDVLEEDERSRASPSRASQTSRGIH